MTWLDLPADHPYGIVNLPYGVFSTPGTEPRVGVRVGDQVLDVGACAEQAGMES
ncbi:MAG: fumarylacetoacetase, partial [Ornithinibacter sp.]